MRLKKWGSKADKTQEAWIAPTLVNGWAQKDGFISIGYMKDEFGFVHLRGLLNGASATSGTVAFTLAEGYRPVVGTIYLPVVGTGSFASIGISSNGEIKPFATSKEWVSLDGATFKVN